jgi:hypothetical protein
MILDCLHTTKEYISHSNLQETTKIIQVFATHGIRPKKVLLTGMACDVEYSDTNSKLLKTFAAGTVELGYDGFQMNI